MKMVKTTTTEGTEDEHRGHGVRSQKRYVLELLTTGAQHAQHPVLEFLVPV